MTENRRFAPNPLPLPRARPAGRSNIPSLLGVWVLTLSAACAARVDRGTLDAMAQVAIPRPPTVSVDDCGWQSGASLATTGGPWRLGDRDPTTDDYRRLVRIARAAGTRLLTLWVLSELDRANTCARPEYNMPAAPSDMTEFGLHWDNRSHVSEENMVLMQLMREESA
jgi:hypothetical protein